ncbi:transposase [Zooshikella ganghwensis]|nr:transposase [Zooshikella ganghwensis]
MSSATWLKATTLIKGALLCRGPRRITSLLRVLGLSNEPRFEKYHRVLNRDKWSCVLCAKILLGLLIALLPSGFPVIVLVDETLERRKGKQIKAKGYYRDAVRSTQKKVVKCLGLKWICMTLVVPLPWNKRPWALPFLTVLAPSKQANEKQGRSHRTTVDWTITMVKLVTRWLKRSWILVGDGAYACIELGHRCRKLNVTLISRLRLDACLYEFPEPTPKGKRGRKRVKGKRICSFKDLAQDASQHWIEADVKWYGGQLLRIRYLTGVHLWYKAGEKPLPIRWVVVINPNQPDRTDVFFSTDTNLLVTDIIRCFVLRWNIEVTFEEVREHLDVETQRQWSDKAIGRTTPVLMGLYSLACVIAKEMRQSTLLQPALTSWYDKKDQATFSDVIAFIRRTIWAEKYFSNSSMSDDFIKLTPNDADTLINQLAMAA